MKKLKELDKKILVGIGLTVAFLILWLVTLPSVSYKSPFDPYSGLNSSQRTEQINKDISDFNSAILFDDNSYCNNIMSGTMKKECLEKITRTAEPSQPQETQPNTEPEKEHDSADIDKFNSAILFNDKTYCESINDEQLRTNCLNRWQ